jgi:DedD protein
MRGVFEDDEELEESRPQRGADQRDRELTLGAGTLLLLFFGLVVVCGLCFGLGYAMGHHGAMLQQTATGAQPAASSSGSIPKPSAAAQPPSPASASQPAAAASDLPQTTAAVAIPVGAPQPGAQATPATPAAPIAASAPVSQANPQPQVRPALPPMGAGPLPAPMSTPAPAPPAAAPPVPTASGSLWVQIAAVSHVEDAEVLTNALRRRGYTVTPRREPSDNLIHVRIGPFNTRDEANRWRMKLLNDGYNAMVQP